MKKRIIIAVVAIIALLVIFIVIFNYTENTKFIYDIKEGDVVFQISQSKQSPAIIMATASPWSHCGIIVGEGDDLYVLEAAGTVKLTPLKQWEEKGRMKIVAVRRFTEDKVKIDYRKYLGKQYDLAFKFDNNKWYCSELVYDIYKNQMNVELCKPRKVKDYHLTDSVKKKMKERGISEEQLVVAPSDIFSSSKFL